MNVYPFIEAEKRCRRNVTLSCAAAGSGMAASGWPG